MQPLKIHVFNFCHSFGLRKVAIVNFMFCWQCISI